MKKITKKDIKRVQQSLNEARAQGNAKEITFLEATLRNYMAKRSGEMKKTTKKDIERVQQSLNEARAQGDAKRITFLEATLRLYTAKN